MGTVSFTPRSLYPQEKSRKVPIEQEAVRALRFGHNMNLFTRPYNKGKGIPVQTWTGPEGSRRLRLPGFKRVGT